MPAKAEKIVFSAIKGEIEMSDIELLSVIERYLNGEMSADERARFEMLRHDNPIVDSRVIEHQQFTEHLKQYGERVEFESLLNSIHNEIDVQALKDEFVHHPSLIVRIWRNHHSKISLAASVAIFAALTTLFFAGLLKTQGTSDEVVALSGKIKLVENSTATLKQQTAKLINIVGASKIDQSKYTPSGTGFAISSDGYVVTALHVINGADSVTIQNSNGDAYHVKAVYKDPGTDIAVLKIVDPSFKSLGALPYGFKRSKADLMEDVFTIGYPLDDMVVGKGYISSWAGSNGDTIRYRVEIKASYGNSGSPLFDENGNIIGIINSKQNQADAAAFAVKSKYLYKALAAMASDSTVNKKVNLSSKNSLTNLSRPQQIKKAENFVFNVKVNN